MLSNSGLADVIPMNPLPARRAEEARAKLHELDEEHEVKRGLGELPFPELSAAHQETQRKELQDRLAA